MELGDRFISTLAKIDCRYALGLLLATTSPLPLDLTAQAQPVSQYLAQATAEQTIIYVNPQTGNDSNGDGTRQSPLKTITQALTIAQPNTTIDLAAGTYSEATGETFPIVIEDKVTLKGSAGGRGHNIIIRGNGYFVSPTGAGQNVAIAATKDAGAIIGVTVTNPHSRGHGLWVESANPVVASNTFTGNGNTGLSVNGNSLPVIEDNLFYNNAGNGLLVYGTSQPQINGNDFEKTGFGVSAVQNTTITLTDNKFTGNRIGIILEGDARATLRNNQIENSLETGLTAIASTSADLGTANQPGNNVFSGNQKYDIQNASSQTILAAGTEIRGSTSGEIDFRGASLPATNSAPLSSERPPLAPLDKPLPIATIKQPPTVEPASGDLPAPPALPSPPPASDTATEEQELVFNAPTASPQPVPFPPSSENPTRNSQTVPNIKYKVLVETTDNNQQTAVRSLFPDAFATVYRGRSVLQVGAFSNKSQAETTSQSLQNLGLNTYILE